LVFHHNEVEGFFMMWELLIRYRRVPSGHFNQQAQKAGRGNTSVSMIYICRLVAKTPATESDS